MTVAELLPHLDAVRPRGPGKWSATCPAHDDRTPSLSITDGERGILLKCWAGCDLRSICTALHLSPRDLFFDALPDPQQRHERARRRAQAQQQQKATARRTGLHMDVLREAEALVQSARDLSIDGWTDDQLDAALNRLADAYACLERETV